MVKRVSWNEIKMFYKEVVVEYNGCENLVAVNDNESLS